MKSIANLIFGFLLLFGCTKESDTFPDELEKFKILGEWQLDKREIDGKLDFGLLESRLIMTTDADPTDQAGYFVRSEGPTAISGKYIVLTEMDAIVFELGNNIGQYDYYTSQNTLVFIFHEGRDEIREYWLRD
ncbi:MAG: hypothetical protein KJP00_01150 [Bacteroidia bacterium]|nr:hypothetical protein [Bacteroidia bacterium]